MRVCLVAGPGHARATAALGVALAAAGHELVAAHQTELRAGDEGSEGSYDLGAVASAARGSDAVVGLGTAGPWAVSAAELVGAVGVAAAVDPPLPSRDLAPVLRVRPPERLYRPVGAVVGALAWARSRRDVNRARRAVGLGPMRNPVTEQPVLGAWSPTLVPPPADWDARTVTVTGDWWSPQDSSWTPDAELEAFLAAGDRPIYVGFGATTGSLAEYALEAILEAWADTYRILLDAGTLRVPSELPDNVRRIESVPTEWLFSRCGALVLEPGAARAHAAARSGITSISVPFTPAERFWADRLYGAGIATPPVDPRSGWEAYKAALRLTLPLRDRAKEIGGRVSAEDGATAAVAALERLLDQNHR